MNPLSYPRLPTARPRRLREKGVNLSKHGVSVKTDKRFNREEYLDATQRYVPSPFPLSSHSPSPFPPCSSPVPSRTHTLHKKVTAHTDDARPLQGLHQGAQRLVRGEPGQGCSDGTQELRLELELGEAGGVRAARADCGQVTSQSTMRGWPCIWGTAPRVVLGAARIAMASLWWEKDLGSGCIGSFNSSTSTVWVHWNVRLLSSGPCSYIQACDTHTYA